MYSVRMRKNADQNKPRIWILFTQCQLIMDEITNMEQVKLNNNDGGTGDNKYLRTLRTTSLIKDPAERTLSVGAHRRES